MLTDDVSQHAYADLLVEGATLPPGMSFAASNALVSRSGTAEAMAVLADVARGATPPAMAVRSIGGALAQVPADATAFAHRSAEFMIVIVAGGPDAVVDAARGGIAAIHARLTPHTEGVYLNFVDTATADDVAAAYPPGTLRRLREVKHAYDPENVFARNHHVLLAPEDDPALAG